MKSPLPERLEKAFAAANDALFELHRAMEEEMIETPGKENWREVYGFRVKLNQSIKRMCENCFTFLRPGPR